MSAYGIEYTPAAARQIAKLPRHVQDDVRPAITRLADNPRPHGCKRLSGDFPYWRIRVDQYRVIYAIDDGIRIVTINKAAHRRDVYRR